MSLPCPLCLSTETKILDRLKTAALNDLWEQSYGIRSALHVDFIDYCSCSRCALKFFTPPVAGGPDIYASLQEFDWYYMDEKAEYAMAMPYLKGVDSILEVGAGSGAFAEYLDVARYVGLDSSPAAVANAARRGIDVVDGTVSDQIAKGDVFGAVVAFQVLEHVPDPRVFLQSCIQCVQPGGMLVVAVPSADGFVGQATNNLLNMPPHHVTHWHDRTLTRVASVVGAKLVALEHEPVATHHREWARHVIADQRLRGLFGAEPRILERSVRRRLLRRFTLALSKVRPPSLTGIWGHTVLAVYRRDPCATPD